MNATGPLDGLDPIPCHCAECTLNRAADEAIEHGMAYLTGTTLLLVSDLIITEATANGQPFPDTYRLARGDGRTVYVFNDPRDKPKNAPGRVTLGEVTRRRRKP